MKKFILGLILALGLSSISANAQTPALTAVQDNVMVSIYDEPCRLQDKIDFPYRATWLEVGKKPIEGCAAGYGDIVVVYFEDRSVAVVPVSHLKPGTEI